MYKITPVCIEGRVSHIGCDLGISKERQKILQESLNKAVKDNMIKKLTKSTAKLKHAHNPIETIESISNVAETANEVFYIGFLLGTLHQPEYSSTEILELLSTGILSKHR